MLILRVYVVPNGPRSEVLLQQALALRAQHGDGLDVEVIDASACPEAAKRDGVFVFPAVVLAAGVGSEGLVVAALSPAGDRPGVGKAAPCPVASPGTLAAPVPERKEPLARKPLARVP